MSLKFDFGDMTLRQVAGIWESGLQVTSGKAFWGER
jgi:hypothetical protein